jgi:dephospho-CoA kinase
MEKPTTTTILAMTKKEGSGARTVANELVSTFGYILYSIRDYLRKEFRDRNKTSSTHQEELKKLGNEIRKNDGVHAVIEPIFNKILQDKRGNSFIIESLLCPAEIEYLTTQCDTHGIRLVMIAIDAPLQTRFERLNGRKDSKGVRDLKKLKKTDSIAYLAKRKEMYIPTIVEHVMHTEEFELFEKDPYKINVPQCLSMVTEDAVFQNLQDDIRNTARRIQEYVLSY